MAPDQPSVGVSSAYSSVARVSRAFVRVNQVLLSSGLPAVNGDFLKPQRLGERDLLRVAARKRGLDFRRHALAKLLSRLESDLLQEGGEEPATDTPRHAEAPVELGGAAVE